MCDHKAQFESMAASMKEMAIANKSSADSQALMATDVAILKNNYATISDRGCGHGVNMVNEAYSHINDQSKIFNARIEKIKDSNWWIKIFGGMAVVIAAVISVFI